MPAFGAGKRSMTRSVRSDDQVLSYELLQVHIVILRNHFGRLFSDYYGSCISVRTDYVWHDAGICNPKPIHSKNTQSRINYITDTAGAALMIKSVGEVQCNIFQKRLAWLIPKNVAVLSREGAVSPTATRLRSTQLCLGGALLRP